MEQYIISLDQGTTSSRCMVFDQAGQVVSSAQKEFFQIYPKPGWVEHDAVEIWATQIGVMKEALIKEAIELGQVAAIGIANQRETTVVWHRETGIPVYNAIVWQDRRTASYCTELIDQGYGDTIQQKTGLKIDAYFSATKIRWILDNVPGAREKSLAGELAFGTIDTWLIWNLTAGECHKTDVTNASRTMLYNITTLSWDADLLELFDIPLNMLPSVHSCSEVFASTSTKLLQKEIRIAGVAGDQQAALFGQMCIDEGMVKNTYGTGCFLLMNIGSRPVLSKNNLVTTIAWQFQNQVQYAIEGSIFIGGAVIQWLRDGLEIISSSSEVEDMARKMRDTAGVYFVPAFAGLGAPHWNQDARGTIVGITRGTTSAHIARAALESIALQTLDVLVAMEKDSGVKIRELRVDGGASVNNLLMQIQANLLKTKVVRPENTETTALGAAYFAGLAIGFWRDVQQIQELWKVDRDFSPDTTINTEQTIIEWNRAIRTANAWTETQN